MFAVKKINDMVIKPVEGLGNSNHWKGKEIFPGRQFFNIALLSRSGSGKTTVIFNLLKAFADKYTIIFLFSYTLKIDGVYKAIVEWIQENKIGYFAAPSFIEDDTNHLEDFMKEHSRLFDDDFEPDEVEGKGATTEIPAHFPRMSQKYYEGFGQPSNEEEKKAAQKERKRQELMRKRMNFIFVFDDQSKQLLHPSIEKFVKMSRHYHSRNIISSQSLTDIRPGAHDQMYALCLFSGMSPRSLDYIIDTYNLSIDPDDFKRLYEKITKKKANGEKNYNFLTVLPMEQEFRRNLNEELVNIEDILKELRPKEDKESKKRKRKRNRKTPAVNQEP